MRDRRCVSLVPQPRGCSFVRAGAVLGQRLGCSCRELRPRTYGQGLLWSRMFYVEGGAQKSVCRDFLVCFSLITFFTINERKQSAGTFAREVFRTYAYIRLSWERANCQQAGVHAYDTLESTMSLFDVDV